MRSRDQYYMLLLKNLNPFQMLFKLIVLKINRLNLMIFLQIYHLISLNKNKKVNLPITLLKLKLKKIIKAQITKVLILQFKKVIINHTVNSAICLLIKVIKIRRMIISMIDQILLILIRSLIFHFSFKVYLTKMKKCA